MTAETDQDMPASRDDECGALCRECYHHCSKDRPHYATEFNPHVCDGVSRHEWVD